MQNYKKVLSLIAQTKEIVVSFAAIALWVLALWFNSKLLPLVNRVEALETKTGDHLEYTKEFEKNFSEMRDAVSKAKEDVAFLRGKAEGETSKK